MSVENKIGRVINTIIIAVYIVVAGLLLLNNLVYGDMLYPLKKYFVWPNIDVFLIGVAVILLGFFIYKFVKFRIAKPVIFILTALLFIAQCFIFYNILFITRTWDAGQVFLQARNLAHDRMSLVNLFYFSAFPNNMWIMAIITGIIECAEFFGIKTIESQLYVIVIIQSILSTVTGYLTYRIVEKKTDNTNYGIIAWLIYVVLVGLSAQTIVPYTDMMSLLFPTLVIFIYQKMDNERFAVVKWGLIVLLSYIGYKIKPTVIIVLIAIVGVTFINEIFCLNKTKLIKTAKLLGASVVAIAVGLGLNLLVNLSLNIPVINEFNTGPIHMLMMGSNEVTNGSFYIRDAELSENILDKEQRKGTQQWVLSQRFNSRTDEDIFKFYQKKALMIFNDGTYAVGEEAGYYNVMFPDKIPEVSFNLKSWYYKGGMYFYISSMIQQGVWIFVLLLNVLLIFTKKNKLNAVLATSLIGIILFDLLFEARARYLLIYAPLYIMAAVSALQGVYDKVDTFFVWCKNRSAKKKEEVDIFD
ncbi:MAG: hypothetical protein K5644_06415 [Lachnospiraceae bacterium]|nr:hypothetical protein [Lachnospiraceae bacterium]